MTVKTLDRWIVALTYAQAEWQAHTGALQRGAKSVLPYTLRGVRRGRWAQGAVKPLFPGYLFIQFDGSISLEGIRKVIGIRDILKSGGQLVILTGAQIADVRKFWRAEYRRESPRLKRHIVIKPGQWMPVPDGHSFAGMPCCVETIDRHGNVMASCGSLTVRFHIPELGASVRARAAQPLNSSKSRAA